MSTTFNACYVEIHQDPNKYNTYFLKVIFGNYDRYSDSNLVAGNSSFELMLNGPGKSKAKDKLRNFLATRGLDLNKLTILGKEPIQGLVSHLVKEAPVVVKDVPKESGSHWRRKYGKLPL